MNPIARTIILALLWIGASSHSYSHQDTVLTLKEGRLDGLPEKFSPATFDVEKKKLRIGSREVVFAPYIAGLFPDSGDFKLRITASWYHERNEPNSLPPYICFEIQKKEWDFSYSVLINLESLELIELQIEVQESKSTLRSFTIDLSPYRDDVTKWEPTEVEKK